MSAILDKIRKLMEVTLENGATQGEVENATAAAQMLMIKHSIELGDLVVHKDDIIEEELEDIRVAYEKTRWTWDLTSAIAAGYNCRVLRKQKWDDVKRKIVYVYLIIGFPEDAKMVKEMVTMLTPVIRNIGCQKAKELPKNQRSIFYNSYVYGFRDGLRNKLTEVNSKKMELTDAERSQYQLIVVKKTDLINKFIDSMGTRSAKSTRTTVNPKAYFDGIEDGQSFNQLNKRLN